MFANMAQQMMQDPNMMSMYVRQIVDGVRCGAVRCVVVWEFPLNNCCYRAENLMNNPNAMNNILGSLGGLGRGGANTGGGNTDSSSTSKGDMG